MILYVCPGVRDWQLSIPLYVINGTYQWGDTGIVMGPDHPLYNTQYLRNPTLRPACFRLVKQGSNFWILESNCYEFGFSLVRCLCFTSDLYLSNEMSNYSTGVIDWC